MGNLLSCDLHRIRKDKLFWIGVLVATIFAIAVPLLLWVLYRNMDTSALDVLGMTINGKSLFFAAFNISADLGLVAPPLIAVILFKDFSQGTIRNKIIAGNKRTSIFLSIYISSLIAVLGITLLYAFLTLGVSLLVFPYQQDPFGWQDFWYLLGSLGLNLNLYLFVAALITCISVSSKSTGAVVLKCLGVTMGASIVTTLLTGGITAMQALGGQDALLKILKFLQNINVYHYITVIGTGTAYKTKELIYMIATPPVLVAALLFLGGSHLRKKDIK